MDAEAYLLAMIDAASRGDREQLDALAEMAQAEQDADRPDAGDHLGAPDPKRASALMWEHAKRMARRMGRE